MSYQVLARKWRPSSFAEMVGQTQVLKGLVHALDQQRLHHAYLFTGTRGVGKTTLARIVAKCLNCEQGISSKPCGQCQTCIEISQGRYPDLIEIDAASRTKVEDTRDLLDNVQYAPTRGRYKVYLIDEVHMLSTHSFNALLKTLEEPPEHVKFLLATTDPQKLPVTVLSRCLQFHLKNIDARDIAAHLKYILDQEKITYEPAALSAIARAANGSLRDALSLLDQAISYGEGSVSNAATLQMLGSVGQQEIIALIESLATQNKEALWTAVKHLAETASDYSEVLNALGRLLYQVALYQVMPQAEALEFPKEQVAELAKIMPADLVQVLYQISLIGKRDLNLAPDPRTGFEMAILRMLAFRPLDLSKAPQRTQATPYTKTAVKAEPSKTTPASPVQVVPAQAAEVPIQAVRAASAQNNELSSMTWHEILAELHLTGMLKQLAYNCALISYENSHLTLGIHAKHASILNDKLKMKLADAIEQVFAKKVKLSIQVEGQLTETPAETVKKQVDQKQQQIEQNIKNDPYVQFLQAEFDAIIEPGSIKPIE
ncbi:MAG: polymerase subunit gamma/tau [Gammaproteobacteria bacterium]|jgi:DNA polymerase-3 subunit gamma/tau|nr:polymerase subunit gamma/tau [Gammaproteobacteria bacterium]